MATKEECLADWNKLHRACSAYVSSNVIYCVSSLMYGLREVAEHLDDYDTYLNLMRRIDYDEAVEAFVMNDADLDDLEQLAEDFGYWDDLLDEIGYTKYVEDFEGLSYESNDSAMSLSEWLETAHNGEETKLRRAVFDLIDRNKYEEVCLDFDLDTDEYESEVYEHWIVDRYFGKELEVQGEVVEEYLGLLIWGRCTTGQSISMDGVIERIVKDLDENHWVWEEVR